MKLKNKKEREEYITNLSNYKLELNKGFIKEWFLKEPLKNRQEILRLQIKEVYTAFDQEKFETYQVSKFKDYYFIIVYFHGERALKETTVAKLVELLKEIKE